MYRPGDAVVYRKAKHTTSPGPRAHAIEPEPRGEFYTYEVDKYWVVEQVSDDRVVVRTRRGKNHELSPSDPRLRPANWWERLLFRNRFPGLSG